MPRKRNPNGFTTDEAQTATLIMTEGHFACHVKAYNAKRYAYPKIVIDMCDKEALEPARRVLGTSIIRATERQFVCPPQLFPPDGKGIWRIEKIGAPAQQTIERLKPLLSKHAQERWERKKQECLKIHIPTRPYTPRRRS